MNNVNTRGMADQQSGSVLIIGLILLLVMSISGVYMMNSSIMDERMTANQRSQTNAFMAAEAGLLAAQKELDSNWSAICAKDDLIVESTFDTGVGNNDAKNDAEYKVVFDGPCDEKLGVKLKSTGTVAYTGVSRVLTAWYKPIPLAGGPGDAPAAISCLGGPCKITPGAGQSSIDGRDYTLPDWDTNSTNEYRPDDSRLTDNIIMPSLYLSDPDNSSVERPKGQSKFCGAEREQCSQAHDSSLFYTESSYPTVDGKPTHPAVEQFFGDGTPMGDLAPTSNDAGTRDKPTVSLNPSIDGKGAGIIIIEGDMEMTGNTRFEGLIVIRGCGTLAMKGTSIIYGAIMVNASEECGDDYSPFGQGGTPTVAYSLEALNNAGRLLPSSLGGLSDWQEDINEG